MHWPDAAINVGQCLNKAGWTMKGIIEFLRRIGILKFGAGAGTYRTAADAPDELYDIYPSKSKDDGKKGKPAE